MSGRNSNIFVGEHGSVNYISPSRLFDPPCHNFCGYLPRPAEGVHGFNESETDMPDFIYKGETHVSIC
jgi:hypothetical protein